MTYPRKDAPVSAHPRTSSRVMHLFISKQRARTESMTVGTVPLLAFIAARYDASQSACRIPRSRASAFCHCMSSGMLSGPGGQVECACRPWGTYYRPMGVSIAA